MNAAQQEILKKAVEHYGYEKPLSGLFSYFFVK